MTSLKHVKLSCLALAISQVIALPSQAVVLTSIINVNTASDTDTSGCTLRSAITAANTNQAVNGCSAGSNFSTDYIVFDQSLNNSTITINNAAGALPDITSAITINGESLNPVDNLTIDGNDTHRIFTVSRGFFAIENVTINNLTLMNGNSGGYGSNGGAISCFGSSSSSQNLPLTITNSILSSNNAFNDGGAIYSNNCNLAIHNSTLSGNSAGDDSGAIYSNLGNLAIHNSTLSGNSADDNGGGILVRNSTMDINNSTLSSNDAGDSGGAIYGSGTSIVNLNNITVSENSASDDGGGLLFPPTVTATLTNSIISGNTANGDGSEIRLFSGGSITAQNNLLGSSEILYSQAFQNFSPDSTNLNLTAGINGVPLDQILAPLADNGGATQTHALVANSPAFNAGDNATCLATDQRGESRANDTQDSCDIGSFEVVPSTITVDTDSDTDITACSLRSAITAANTNQVVNGCAAGSTLIDNIVFDPSLNNSTITINNPAGALPDITSNIIINGTDPVANLTINGNNTHRIFNLTNGGDLTINNLTLTNGNQPVAYGGAIRTADSTLTINNSTISGNSAFYGGGIFALSNSTTTINNSTISGNSSIAGGGVSSFSSTMTINNSTISGNSAERYGSGISASGTMTINNSTISSNSIDLAGGGIYLINITSTISNSIISGNKAPQPGNEIRGGGGVNLTLNNNLLGTNSDEMISDFISGTIPNNLGSNLFANVGDPINGLADFFGISGYLNLSLNQIISPLADNGGPTLTHGLVSGSPALDAGDNSTCLATDQRGEARVNSEDDPCDIGSFEGFVQQEETLFTIPLPNGKTVIFGL